MTLADPGCSPSGDPTVAVQRHTFWCEARFRHALTAEMFETFPSGGSIYASTKLEGIDGRAPQERVEHVA